MRDYYVYEYIRLDTNEPFYIGKGKGERWRHRNREYNRYFQNIVNNIPVAVIILNDNLTEQEAFKIECWYIWQLRDIQGYWLVNGTDGGEGGLGGDNWAEKGSEKYKERCSNLSKTLGDGRLKGEKNPMFGKGDLNKKPILITTPNGKEIVSESIVDASEKSGVCIKAIRRCIKNKVEYTSRVKKNSYLNGYKFIHI